jgi:hypothetical protein
MHIPVVTDCPHALEVFPFARPLLKFGAASHLWNPLVHFVVEADLLLKRIDKLVCRIGVIPNFDTVQRLAPSMMVLSSSRDGSVLRGSARSGGEGGGGRDAA